MSDQLNTLESMASQFAVPLLIGAGIVFLMWTIALVVALQAYNKSEAAQIERLLKQR